MPSKTQDFETGWAQTAAWAQQNGIKYNQYYPVYQLDSQRILANQQPMSQAEREHAIQAAADPNQTTQLTPSTAPNPGNVIHNTITDARNIFTGLGDIVIHPLHNGLVDSVKNTFDLIDGSHHLQGNSAGAKLGDALTSTVLSWVPGAMDIGNVLKVDPTLSGSAGAKYLAEHPISSILDISPLAKLGGLVKDTETASALEKTGMNPDQLAKAGPVRLGKALIMNKKTGMPNPAGGFLTIGDKFHDWMGKSVINTNPAIADMMSGGTKVMNHWTNVKRFISSSWDEATEKITTPEQVAELQKVFQKATEVGLDKAMEGVDDPRVIEAVNAYVEQNQWVNELSLNAEDGPLLIRNIRTGRNGLFSLVGHKAVIASRNAAQMAEDALLRVMPEAEQLVAQSEALGQHATQSTQALQSANDVARKTQVEQPKGEQNVSQLLPGGSKRFKTGISKSKVAQSLFGTGGWVDRLIEKARAGEWETVAQGAKDTLKRLDNWGADRVNVEEMGPEFQAVRQQVDNLRKTAEGILEVRKRGSKMAYGKAKEWTKQKPYRDARHAQESDSLKASQKIELTKFRKVARQQLTHLHKAYVVKRREIMTRYAKARSDRDHTIADGTQNINARYALEKKQLETRHLQARATRQELVRTSRANGLQIASEDARIAPGDLGSPEAIQAGKTTLEVARRQEIADLVRSLPTRPELMAKQRAEMSAAKLAENEMTTHLKAQQARDEKGILARHAGDTKRLETENLGRKGREGPFSEAVDAYRKTQDEFSTALFKHPSDNFQPVWTNLAVQNLVEDERARPSIAYKARTLAKQHGWTQDMLEQLHTNKQLLAQLVQMGLRDTLDDPIFEDLDTGLIQHAENLAYKQLDDLAKAGLNPYWIHQVSPTQVENDAKGSAGIRFIVGKGEPKPNALKPRTWGIMGQSTKFDVQVGLDHATRSFLNREALRDYVSTYADNHVVTARQIQDTLFTHRGMRILDEGNLLATAESEMGGWNLQEFDPESSFGFKLARWGEGKVYMDSSMIKAIEKLTSGDGLFKGGIIDKGTKLFRYSILGLSPRYTAHIVFGGTMLLALHDPLFFVHIPQMLSDMKEGNIPEDMLTRPTNMGTTDWQMVSQKEAAQAYGVQFGKDTAHYLAQEHIEVKQGIPWQKASPLQWVKALADLNLHFTSTVVHMQQGLAGLAEASRVERRGYLYDEAGNKVEVTQERAAMEGMKHVAHVFGDLRRMSPFERDVARTIMPFYGWQKHILNYVMTYPGDHPWRAMMLANMAEFDIANAPGGLPSRYQFLAFMGTPDAQGNVTAFDLRAINPLRDTANYATWGGLFSSLNPAIGGALAAVNPEIIYGGNTLYPHLTYDQFYGVKEAGAQGNLLTAAEQFVPQVGGIQSAMQLVGQRQGMNSSQLIKSIGNQLNFPWVPQTINLRQEAARTAIDQYQVTAQLASNAWQTGDFSQIADLGSVPDPRNADYETPVSDLEQLYNSLASAYPGQAPQDTAQPLPTLSL